MIGRTLGHYRILERVGAGGMGEVYRARDQTLGRDVALKVLPAELAADEASRARLLRAARMASSLGHPNVCTIHDVGEAEGRPYIVMELVPGRALADAIPPHGLPADAVVAYGGQIAAALAHAHEHGVIHRDLKTQNVLVTLEGLVKVLDFGLARHAENDRVSAVEPSTITATGSLVGTAHYLAPELLRGARADERTDIWALGVVLYEMATGTAPFRGRTDFELSAAILNAPPAPLPDSLPAGLRAVLERCLAKEPARRYRRAGEVRAALEGAFAGGAAVGRSGVALGRPTARGRGQRLARWLVPAGAAALLALAWSLDIGGLRRRFLSPGRASIRSLAVLPLENLSRDPEQEYFADGMTEELITSLANLEGVSVISRTSAMRYKGTRKSIPQIARELGVDALVEGSALRAGDRVRITAQLIDARSDQNLWANSYMRELRDVLVLQDEVARAIASEILTTLGPRVRRGRDGRRTVHPEAYEAYLRGRFFWNRRSPEGFRLAIEQFERARALDPGYAAAYSGLADAYAVMGVNGIRSADESFPLAREAALSALRLDDGLAEAHVSLAFVKVYYDWDRKGAEVEYRRAIEFDPNYAPAHQWYSIFLEQSGRSEQALSEIRKAHELDPLSPTMTANLGRRLAIAGRRYEEALAKIHDALELDPSNLFSQGTLAEVYQLREEYANALREEIRADSLSGTPLQLMPDEGRTSSAMSARDYWRMRLRRLELRAKSKHVGPASFAACYVQLDEKARAFEWLDRALKARDSDMPWLKVYPVWEPVRSDPRFQALLRQVGLEP